MTSYRLASGHI